MSVRGGPGPGRPAHEGRLLASSFVSRKPSVLVAMSGGVDSSVAACLLAERGYRVLGSHMKLIELDGVEHGCCGAQAEADARAVADVAGFDFEIVNMTDEFSR